MRRLSQTIRIVKPLLVDINNTFMKNNSPQKFDILKFINVCFSGWQLNFVFCTLCYTVINMWRKSNLIWIHMKEVLKQPCQIIVNIILWWHDEIWPRSSLLFVLYNMKLGYFKTCWFPMTCGSLFWIDCVTLRLVNIGSLSSVDPPVFTHLIVHY